MPAGTRPGRVLELTVVTMGANQYVLCTSDSSTAARLRRQVRKLAGIRGYFDLIHHQKGAVFGLVNDFGTLEYANLQGKTLYDLGVQDGSVVTILNAPPSLDEDGNEIPALVSSSESDAEPVSYAPPSLDEDGNEIPASVSSSESGAEPVS